ncbi:MAG: ferrous iron transport protein A [Clostridia bacterium]|nr:ferrous iron transport protein A [Clostridia bacterium]
MISLKDAKIKAQYTIEKIDNIDKKINQRLCEMGFVSGQKVRVTNKSIFGGVRLVEIRGYTLSIRTSLLKDVWVK